MLQRMKWELRELREGKYLSLGHTAVSGRAEMKPKH
jgi:hypothetical protein